MDYTKYQEYHTFTYNGETFVYHPFMFAQGCWTYATPAGKPGIAADLALQHELNKAYFEVYEIPSLYTRFMNSSKEDREEMKTESMTWLTLKVKSLISNQKVPDSIFKKQYIFSTGGLYFYNYSPKLKDKLPYWDSFPLTVVLKREVGGFLGLNLHYLDNQTRMIILEKMMSGAYKKYNSTTDELFTIMSYDNLKHSQTIWGFKNGIKRYLFSHIQGKILQLESHEWGFAANLAVANWKSNTTKRKKRR